MAELLQLTAAEASRAIEAKELSPAEYLSAWQRVAATDDLNAYLWKSDPSDERRATSD